LSVTSCRKGAAGTASLAYVPFGMSTYAAVTPSNIDEDPHCRLTLSDKDPDLVDLESLVETAGQGSLDEAIVRLKIVKSSGEVVLLDKNGGVRGRRDGALSPAALARANNIMTKHCPTLGAAQPGVEPDGRLRARGLTP
jgi:hypothetical protein